MEQIIKDLEGLFNSKVIVYVTGERQPANLATQVALDILPPFKKILKPLPENTERITLVLNTSGGNIDTPWPLVNAIRECCTHFDVVVLDKALSAGTLIALGADSLYMSKFSHLSPIDPAKHYLAKGEQKTLEIEDTIGYIDFVKNKVGITEQNALAELTKELTKEVEPTQLGSVNRTHALIRNVAKNLLSVHVKPISDRDQKDIIEHLAEKLYAHGHLINKREAKKIGFGELIKTLSAEQETKLDELREAIDVVLKQDEPFIPENEINPEENEKNIVVARGIIYADAKKFNFNSHLKLMRQQVPPQMLTMINIAELKSLWEEVE